VNDLEIPTIGVLNGPGFHTEICLMCDITICSEDAIIFDLHYDIGSVPGDGIHSCLLELLGVKRGAYALLTGQAIDAKTALEYGLVNEVVPRDKLLDRAWQLADHIMTQPRITRRITTQIVRRPWKKRITDDLDGGFGMQMFAHLAKKKSIHSRKHIDESVAYVKQGKRNNFE
jgi:enoyl-CoA hydratase/carnithine racemase